ncbi:MAG: Crp/Fnr family transcriptional regulator [Alphaproteobacteria bacterium]
MHLRRRVRVVPKRTILYREGEAWEEFYSLHTGWAFNYRISGDGKRQIFDFLIPGDGVNLSSLRLDRAPLTVQALTDLTLCVFDRSELDRYVHEDVERTHRVENYWLNVVWAVKNNLMDIGRRSSTQRIARFILHLEERLRERGQVTDGPFPFPLGHPHIADALGLTPVHVNRVISAFRRQGLIELRGKKLHIKKHREFTALAN